MDQHHQDNHCDFHHNNDHHHMCQLKAAHLKQVSGQTSSTSRTKTRTGGHHGNQNTGFTTWTLSRVLLLDLRLTASLPLRHSFKDQTIPALSFRIFLSSNLEASRQHTAGCVLIQLVRHFNQSRQYQRTKYHRCRILSYQKLSYHRIF